MVDYYCERRLLPSCCEILFQYNKLMFTVSRGSRQCNRKIIHVFDVLDMAGCMLV